jgi:heme A synthase
MLKTEAAPRVSCMPFARFAWGVLAYNLPVILWGAYVRASGSGAGCGAHWPLCGGEVTPVFETVARIVEFLHRASSGIDGVLVVALFAWAFWAFPSGHPARLGAVLSFVFILTEGALGASLVLLEHVATDQSAARGWWDSAHLINTFALLACLSLTAWWGMGKPRVHLRGRAAWIAGATLVSVTLLAVTGAIAALADTLFPASTLAAGLAQDFDPAANAFVHLRGLHPVLASGVGIWLFVFAAGAVRAASTRSAARAVIALAATQLAVGLLTLLLLTPLWLQMMHLLVADLLWIALVLLCAAKLAQPRASS